MSSVAFAIAVLAVSDSAGAIGFVLAGGLAVELAVELAVAAVSGAAS